MAPLTADQLSVALVVVILLVARLVGALQPEDEPVVVNVACIEYPVEQLAFTCHTYAVLATNPVRARELVVAVTVVQVEAADVLY